MKKVFLKIIAFIFVFIVGAITAMAIYFCWYKSNDPIRYVRREFSTNFTEEEHVERISEISKRILDKDLQFYIKIIKNFDGDAEYFLVQTYYQSTDGEIDKYNNYLIGCIVNEAYYSMYEHYWFQGENPYSRANALNEELYYGHSNSWKTYERDYKRGQCAWKLSDGKVFGCELDENSEIIELKEENYLKNREEVFSGIYPYQ